MTSQPTPQQWTAEGLKIRYAENLYLLEAQAGDNHYITVGQADAAPEKVAKR